MEPLSAGRLLFVLQLVFINDQQPTGWGQKQQALCLILFPEAAGSSRQLQASRGPLAAGQIKESDHSELRASVVK